VGKIRRGNYIFITRKGDHSPRHVHIYLDNKEIAKWDLENKKVMEGKISRAILNLLHELEEEGKL